MIKPVLEIKTIPMSMEFKINKAHYEISNENTSIEIKNGNGCIEMRMEPIKLNIDTLELNSVKSKHITKNSLEHYPLQSKKAVYEATASYGEEGSMTINIQIMNNPVSDIALQKFNSDVSFNYGLSSATESDTSWNPQDISIRYEMDKLNFDWKVNRPQINFIPGNIEFIIKEYPKLEINYIGTPIFVPPSADPNYKPIDTMA
nr:DUF6470 family protein [Sedimentibacter sp.]